MIHWENDIPFCINDNNFHFKVRFITILQLSFITDTYTLIEAMSIFQQAKIILKQATCCRKGDNQNFAEVLNGNLLKLSSSFLDYFEDTMLTL